MVVGERVSGRCRGRGVAVVESKGGPLFFWRDGDENSRNSWSKFEWKENFLEHLGIPREVVLFLEIFKNDVPFPIVENSNRKFWLNGES